MKRFAIWCSDISGIGGQSQVTLHVAEKLVADSSLFVTKIF